MNHIKVEQRDRVVTVYLHRPEVLNALNAALMTELVDALRPLDRDPGVGCFVITGSERAFAAGADIREMAPKSSVEMSTEDYFAGWDSFTALRTPKIAAVAGYALVIPGIGGTQRLTRLVGKAKAMDMILTGRLMGATEAEQAGLVARVFPADRLLPETMAAAEKIAAAGKLAAMTAREAVDRALEVGLREGLLFERRVFHALFATEDQAEGMRAFLEKRPAQFSGR
jgi:enoyl-CoA hydratase